MEPQDLDNLVETKLIPAIERVVDNTVARKVQDALTSELQKQSAMGRKVEDIRNAPEVRKMMDVASANGVGRAASIVRNNYAGLGSMAVSSDQWKFFADKNFRGQSQAIGFNGLGIGRTAGITDLDDLYLVQGSQFLPGIANLPLRQLHVRDLMNIVQTTAGQIEFVQQTGFTNNSATRARRNSDPATVTAAAQNAITVDRVSRPIADIEAHLPYPRIALSDTPAVAGFVESQLTDGLLNVEDTQILYGGGTSPNMMGIMSEANCGSFDWSAGEVGDNKADALMRAILSAMVAQYQVDGIVMHPNDWAAIAMLKDTTDQYLIGGVHLAGQMPTLWGKPVVLSVAMTSGEALVGAFRSAATYYLRQDASIQVFDQHSDWAIKGLVAFYATLRGAVVTSRPENFVKVTFDSAPA